MLTVTTYPRKSWKHQERLTYSKLGRAAKPTAEISGQAERSQIIDHAINAEKAEYDHWWVGTGGGTAAALTLTIDSDRTAYEEGYVFAFKASVTCAATATLNVTPSSGTPIGAKKIYSRGATVLAGAIQSGRYYVVRYNADLDSSAGGFEIVSQDHRPSWLVGEDAGSTDDYVVTTPEGWATLYDGLTVLFRAATGNTGACTLNLNSAGAKALRKEYDSNPSTGDILAGQWVLAVYESDLNSSAGGWQILSTWTPLSANNVVIGTTRNLVVKNNSATPGTKVDVTADEILLKDSSGQPKLVSGLSVTGNISTTGANGLDTGTISNSTWYYLWAITDGSTDAVLFSTSSSSPTMPSGYTYKALIGVLYVDSGGSFYTFHQHGREVFYVPSEHVIFDSQTGVTSYTSQAVSGHLPPEARQCRGRLGSKSTTIALIGHVAGSSTGVGTNRVTVPPIAGVIDNFTTLGEWRIPIITSQTIFWKVYETSAVYRMELNGFEF